MVFKETHPDTWPESEIALIEKVRGKLNAPPGSMTWDETVHMLDDVWGAMGDLEGCKVTQVDVPRLSFPGLVDQQPGGTVDAEWVEPAAGAAKDAPVCVFIHGGGYVIASNKVYRKMAGALAKRGWRVLTMDYRLAAPMEPHFTFPCGLIDILSCYAYVIKSGVDPKHVVISGDSAGGGGTLVTGIYLRDHGKEAGLPQAAALIPICPWSELGANSPSFNISETHDYLEKPGTRPMAQIYVGFDEEKWKNPLVSPWYDEVKAEKLPPMLFSLGAHDRLRDEGLATALKRLAGGEQLVVVDHADQPHVFQTFVDLPVAQHALNEMDRFARAVIKGDKIDFGKFHFVDLEKGGKVKGQREWPLEEVKKHMREKSAKAKADGWEGNPEMEKMWA
ncbi:Alpha/Beta hydrolase protein [Hyaloraphidium curvatum]|nr:Alpha/Beta hydrolase protein [Hyaloraphidium curvatum]